MPYGTYGPKPAGASAFISVYVLLNSDALAGIALPAITILHHYSKLVLDYSMSMPARASASDSIDTLMNAKELASFATKRPVG